MSNNDRRRRRETLVNAPIDGLRINGMSERERQRQHGAPATLDAIPADKIKSEARSADKVYDPPWSYLDPDNPEWEDFRRKRAAEAPIERPTMVKTSAGSPVVALAVFFKENGRNPEYVGVSQVTWMECARTSGIVFTKKDFEAAWRHAVQAGYVTKLKGAPTKARQSKRARKG
jgi:hypothetical protein